MSRKKKAFLECCELAVLQVDIYLSERLRGELSDKEALRRIRAEIAPLARESLERAGLKLRG